MKTVENDRYFNKHGDFVALCGGFKGGRTRVVCPMLTSLPPKKLLQKRGRAPAIASMQ